MSGEIEIPTSEEIDHRLSIVSELRNLCLSLGQAKLTPEAPDDHLIPETAQPEVTPTACAG